MSRGAAMAASSDPTSAATADLTLQCGSGSSPDNAMVNACGVDLPQRAERGRPDDGRRVREEVEQQVDGCRGAAAPSAGDGLEVHGRIEIPRLQQPDQRGRRTALANLPERPDGHRGEARVVAPPVGQRHEVIDRRRLLQRAEPCGREQPRLGRLGAHERRAAPGSPRRSRTRWSA